MSVVLATVTRGSVRMEYMASVLDALRARTIDRVILKEGDHYLDAARNSCVDTFLEMDAEWLLFVDDDQTFSPEQVTTLLAKVDDEHRVVAGWYLSTIQSGIAPVVFRWGEHERYGEHYVKVSVTDIRESERDERGYVPCDAVGTGFMAIHRTLLDEMRHAFPLPTSPFAELVINGVHCGEDLTFCSRVKQLGYGIFINPDVHVGHIKTLELKET